MIDQIGSISDLGNIFLTNIQRFSNRNLDENNDGLSNYFLGKTPVKKTIDNKVRVKNIVKKLDDLLVLNI